MYAIVLSVAMLGELNPMVQDMLRESDRKHTDQAVQAQRDMAARNLAYDNQEAERTNTYIIAGAVVAGLVLMGLLARSGKKA